MKYITTALYEKFTLKKLVSSFSHRFVFESVFVKKPPFRYFSLYENKTKDLWTALMTLVLEIFNCSYT